MIFCAECTGKENFSSLLGLSCSNACFIKFHASQMILTYIQVSDGFYHFRQLKWLHSPSLRFLLTHQTIAFLRQVLFVFILAPPLWHHRKCTFWRRFQSVSVALKVQIHSQKPKSLSYNCHVIRFRSSHHQFWLQKKSYNVKTSQFSEGENVNICEIWRRVGGRLWALCHA